MGSGDGSPPKPGLQGAVMICGTASDVGKSRIVGGLCRLLARRGVRVAPFKAQNMALNSYVTRGDEEIGRSQAAQALAAGVEPEAAMNPILLKPTGGGVSQVVVMGRAQRHADFDAYREQASDLRGAVHDALEDLRRRFDVVVCEGAGGAAEINLLDRDLVNLPLARDAGIPVVLVADVERGGVFAALHGSVDLLPDDLQPLVRAFVVNKMRGDPRWLKPGLDELARRHGIPTLGVMPWIDGLGLDAEDSLGLGGAWRAAVSPVGDETLEVGVVTLPHIANFTDVDPLGLEPGVVIRPIVSGAIGDVDLIVLPGTKATVADLDWLEHRGIADALRHAARRDDGPVILGICGGMQMLGHVIDDEVESHAGGRRGLGLLPLDTVFERDKVVRRRRGSAFGAPVRGYEIHHGRVRLASGAQPWVELDDDGGAVEDDGGSVEGEGCRRADGRVMATSLHGLFESDAFRRAFLLEVSRLRNRAFVPGVVDFAAARVAQFDRMADLLEEHVDVGALETIIRSTS
jgi:adenosylcobyric acid synthase